MLFNNIQDIFRQNHLDSQGAQEQNEHGHFLTTCETMELSVNKLTY